MDNQEDNLRQIDNMLTRSDEQILAAAEDTLLHPSEELAEIRSRSSFLSAITRSQYSPQGFLPARSHLLEAVFARTLKNKNLAILAQIKRATEIFDDQRTAIIRLDRISTRRYNTVRHLDFLNRFLEMSAIDKDARIAELELITGGRGGPGFSK